jgi:hypothetical protein
MYRVPLELEGCDLAEGCEGRDETGELGRVGHFGAEAHVTEAKSASEGVLPATACVARAPLSFEVVGVVQGRFEDEDEEESGERVWRCGRSWRWL